MRSAHPTSGGVQTALARLGVGPMYARNSQADTLDAELDNYLDAEITYANVVEFWQVCINCSLLSSADSSLNCRITRKGGQPSSSLP